MQCVSTTFSQSSKFYSLTHFFLKKTRVVVSCTLYSFIHDFNAIEPRVEWFGFGFCLNLKFGLFEWRKFDRTKNDHVSNCWLIGSSNLLFNNRNHNSGQPDFENGIENEWTRRKEKIETWPDFITID